MSMINCQDCNKEISDAAPSCPNCGRPNINARPPERPVSLLLGLGIFVVPIIFSWFTLRSGHSSIARVITFSWLLFSIALIVAEDDVRSTSTFATNSGEQIRSDSSTPYAAAQTTQAEQFSDGLSGSQKNAVRSAKQYLSIQGFSRIGLIEQLSSDAGDGYAVSDATIAVDSLGVDWKKQAVRSAQQYLTIQGFSCNGLIDQLSSSAGDDFTMEQATYGAKQAGACN